MLPNGCSIGGAGFQPEDEPNDTSCSTPTVHTHLVEHLKLMDILRSLGRHLPLNHFPSQKAPYLIWLAASVSVSACDLLGAVGPLWPVKDGSEVVGVLKGTVEPLC